MSVTNMADNALPFAGEFPAGVLEPGRCAFVRIRIERDPDGQPKRRARRRLQFCEGGTARRSRF